MDPGHVAGYGKFGGGAWCRSGGKLACVGNPFSDPHEFPSELPDECNG